MKLGKSLIITGLLFSSVLGSVNVNNITAMAADNVKQESKDEKIVDIKFTSDNQPVQDSEFIASVDSKINVDNNAETVDLSKIKIPYNYEFADPDKKSLAVKTENGRNVITVEVKNKEMNSVKVRYTDSKGKDLASAEITEKKLPETLELLNPKRQAKKENLKDIPKGFEVEEYLNGSLILKMVEKASSGQQGSESSRPNPRPSHKGHSGYALQRVRISFIDQDGDEVGYKQLNGKDTFSSKIEAPAGYTLVNSSDATIKFNKKGNKDIKVKVTKNRPTPVMEKGIVTTNSGLYFHLYTIDGKEITNRGLSGDSKWFTDQYATINGEKMFRVATNEWVKATDVYK